MRRRTWALAAVSALAAGGATVVAIDRVSSADEQAAPPPTAAETTNTAVVERRDIVDTATFDGTIDYRDHRTVDAAPPGEAAAGTVTEIVAAGAEVSAGTVLYELDGHPTVVVAGAVPMHRALSDASTDGPDIRQLERYLVAEGFDPDGELTVDEEFTGKTAELVEAWEEQIGVAEPDGRVDQSQIVFLPGPAVVTGVHVLPGQAAPAGTPLLDLALTESGRVFDALVPLADQATLEPGTQITVSVAGQEVAGTVESVLPATVVGPNATGEAEPMAIVRAEIDPVALPQVTATAELSVTETLADDVLVVPVAALITLAEGGYAVELVDGGATRLVGVTPGAFGDGIVEVRGEGLAEGSVVVVP